MKGLIRILLVVAIFAIGLIFALSATGTTPISYSALPEEQFSKLLSTYYYTSTNVERTILENSDTLFSNIQDSPIVWNNGWTTDESLFYTDINSKLSENFKKVADKYFSSVYVVGGDTEVNISGIDSRIKYSPGGKLEWNYTYQLYLKKKIYGHDVVNEINTTRSILKKFDFLDMDEVYRCTSSFFKNMNSNPLIFSEEPAQGVEIKLREILMKEIPAECSSFDIDLKPSVWCGALKCNCKKVNSIPVVITLTKNNIKIAFSKNFTNIQCGENGGSCSTGLDCGNRDCISGSCGTCWSGSFGSPCSPKGSSKQKFRCLKTTKGEYKCLPDVNIKIYLDSEKIKNGEEIYLNCGQKHKILEVEGARKYFFNFNGVEIEPRKLDLCDLPRVDGDLIIYAIFEDDAYGVGRVKLNFALSKYIDKINGENFVYKFDREKCNSFKNNAIASIKTKLNGMDICGYKTNVELLDTKCSGGDTSWSVEQYSLFRVDFIEDSTIHSVYHLIKYAPLGKTQT